MRRGQGAGAPSSPPPRARPRMSRSSTSPTAAPLPRWAGEAFRAASAGHVATDHPRFAAHSHQPLGAPQSMPRVLLSGRIDDAGMAILRARSDLVIEEMANSRPEDFLARL